VTCAGCGADVERPERIGRGDRCPRCSNDLRSCRQCRFYEPRLADQCREPQADRVTDKSAANFCDYFAVAEGAGSPAASAAESTPARDALTRLFRR
jgi:hypothetical protein